MCSWKVGSKSLILGSFKSQEDWGDSSVIECMHKDLGLIPSTEKKKKAYSKYSLPFHLFINEFHIQEIVSEIAQYFK